MATSLESHLLVLIAPGPTCWESQGSLGSVPCGRPLAPRTSNSAINKCTMAHIYRPAPPGSNMDGPCSRHHAELLALSYTRRHGEARSSRLPFVTNSAVVSRRGWILGEEAAEARLHALHNMETRS